jgi:hypothetical protein
LPILAIMALFELPYLAVQFFGERSSLATILTISSQSQTISATALQNDLGTLLGAALVVFAITLGYYILLMPLAQGAVIRVVGDDYLDRSTSVGAGLGTALRRIWGLVGYVLLELGVGVAPLALAVVLAVLVGGGAGAGLLAVLLLGWVVYAIFVFIKMSLGIQAVVLEHLSPSAAFRRSWQLTAGSFWRIVLGYLVINVASAVLSGILNGLAGILIGTAPAITQASVQLVTTGVIDIFTSPFILILLTLIYYDIRIRREAFDIEMLAQSL